jgi:hypothetical protein
VVARTIHLDLAALSSLSCVFSPILTCPPFHVGKLYLKVLGLLVVGNNCCSKCVSKGSKSRLAQLATVAVLACRPSRELESGWVPHACLVHHESYR